MLFRSYIGHINTDIAQYGFYRCTWATNTNAQTKSSGTYIPRNDTNSGTKDLLKKIIGQ